MNTHSRPPHRWRLPATLAAAVLVGPLVGTAGTAGGPAQAANGDDAAWAGARLEPTSLANAGFGSHTVRLLTGAAYEVDTQLNGQVAVIPIQASRAGEAQTGDPAPVVEAVERSGEPARLSAIPPEAAGLVDAGHLDSRLFDLTQLIDHRESDGSVPVTVHFDTLSAAGEVAATADALPGSEYVDGTATDSHATVAVDADAAATFWNAVTKPRSYGVDDPEGWLYREDDPATPRELAPGIAGLTLDGAPLEERTAPAETATDRLTIQVHASEDKSRWNSPDQAQGAAISSVTGVTGPLAKATKRPSSAYCSDPQCRTVAYVWDVPPGVYWAKLHGIREKRAGRTALSRVQEPEVVVNGDTTLDIHLDDGIWIEPETPRPTEIFDVAITSARTYPDGDVVSTLSWGPCGSPCEDGHYLIPTQRPAETGSFNVVVVHNMRQPEITMQLAGEGRDGALQALYSRSPTYPDKNLDARNQTFEVVDAGYGSEAEFEAIDAEGKLVLLAPDPDLIIPGSPHFQHEVLARAEQYGAVAVLGDPTCPFPGPFSDPCYVPMSGGGYYEDVPVAPGPPLITLGLSDAARLKGLLEGSAPVRITVDSPVDQSEYFYSKAWHFWGGVPASIDQDLDADDFVTGSYRFHDVDNGEAASVRTYSSVAAQNVIAGNSVDWEIGSANHEVDAYISRSNDIVRDLRGVAAWGQEYAGEIFTADAKSRQEDFGAAPRSIGPQLPQPFSPDNRPQILCHFCRVDDLVYPVSGFNAAGQPYHRADEGLLPNAVLTDSEGTEIPMSVRDGLLPVYELPPERKQYTLTSEFAQGSTFAWTFTSESATEDNRPRGTSCLGEIYLGDSSCGEALPMIYLRYDAPVDLDNTAPAGSRHTVDVAAYHHAEDAPSISRPKVQVSFDDGETWQSTKLTKGKQGAWKVRFTVPPLEQTSGYVSLRTTAEDAAGNSTAQTLVRAYELR